MIWLALLIPLIAMLIVAKRHPRKIAIFEYILLLLIPLSCILIGKSCSISNQTKDVEFWNSHGTHAQYEEAWRERWTEMETYTTTDSKGNTQIRTRMVTRNRSHPEKWRLYDNIGDSYSISKSYFEQLCKMWNSRVYKDMHRGRNGHTILKDGDAYVTTFDKVFEHTVPLCTQHKYENKVQASKSVFNFEEVSDETKAQYKLFEYPAEDIFNFNPILGHSNKTATDRLSFYNAHNGKRKQIHMMLLVFDKQPLEAGLFQESYWKGGNKNEFIVCVGLDGKEIKWTRVVSWTEREELKIRVARQIKEMKEFDAVKVVDYMGENIPKGFIRKQFAEFNYITVEPTMTAVIVTYCITILLTLIISLIAIFNNFNLGGHGSYSRY